ncbi:Glyoxalase/Bleomycin resistance protein/Dihydroxybiphenyl dioxygenase [Thelonectria olida]|uniref:Glyoxalase/Bleomycin resistance protein/Dihydroxybiphenyl dioxygenase n=1 Tax=Thelonectria olida TaxID=1576542 RepID=A0A9P9AJ71_9HYPO|nr:Glyoxalase/Bleomycin resistance protein/Dihydroxybiphenyl dioxygenase [Thelonectria olida]
MAKPLAAVKALDHLVITCTNVSKTAEWYSRYLGMTTETFTSPSDPKTVRTALRFGQQKINLHQKAKEFEPKANTALPGTADLCFLVEEGIDLDKLVEELQQERIDVLEGGSPSERTGALGPIRSVYIRDPDGNLIELSHYIK